MRDGTDADRAAIDDLVKTFFADRAYPVDVQIGAPERQRPDHFVCRGELLGVRQELGNAIGRAGADLEPVRDAVLVEGEVAAVDDELLIEAESLAAEAMRED